MRTAVHEIQPRTTINRLNDSDRAAHDWYRFVLSFPPHLVREYLERFDVDKNDCVLDPFCGTGTTIVECKKRGIPSVGVEAHPMSYLASRTKVDWSPDPDELEAIATAVAERAVAVLERDGIIDDPQPNLLREEPALVALRTLPPAVDKLLLAASISPLPLHKTLVLIDEIDRAERYRPHMQLALARALVSTISNLHFGPEVGVASPKPDAPVISAWLGRVVQLHTTSGICACAMMLTRWSTMPTPEASRVYCNRIQSVPCLLRPRIRMRKIILVQLA